MMVVAQKQSLFLLHILCYLLLSEFMPSSNGYSLKNSTPKHRDVKLSQSSRTSRKTFLTSLVTTSLPTYFLVQPSPSSFKANAIQPKNEALCGTGFFEHIYEYKCTAIGDIEDEGKTKDLSSNEASISDDLMGKLGLSDDIASFDFDDKNVQSGGEGKATRENNKNGITK
mmetsp:Transcript_24197/g.29784  ORF Transcript_24197/g.29784 Transcript_24197/m.29784 type:complete len:170 (+) Transcript_24197:70-579(+)